MPLFVRLLRIWLFFAIVSLFFVMGGAVLEAQVQAFGVVKEYRGAEEKVPLDGVEINVLNAAGVLSGQDGGFVLQFRTLHAGDLVQVRRIEKAGYEIFNKEALEQWIISGRKEIPFTIVMCPVSRFKQMRDNYERVSSANYEAQFQKEKKRLAKRRDEGTMTLPQYEKALQRATISLQQSRTQVKVVAERFSRIDLSEVSKSEREVIQLVQQGEVEKAIVTAEERGNMMHLAELYQLAGGVENMEKADSLLRCAAWSDTTQLRPMEQWAEFAYRQGDWTSACQAYELLLRHISDSPVRRSLLSHNLGVLYMRLNDRQRAATLLQSAASDIESFCLRDAEGWRPTLASVQLSLATLDLGNGQLTEALEGYRQVCRICEAVLAQDTAHQSALRHWVKAENNMGIVYMQQRDYTHAQQILQSALMHSQRIDKGEVEVAGVLNSLGALYLTTDHLPEAENRLKQCERLLLPQMARNPQGVMPDLARCYYNLYRICNAQQERKQDAARYLDTAIAQYRILAERQPQSYQGMLDALLKIQKEK